MGTKLYKSRRLNEVVCGEYYGITTSDDGDEIVSDPLLGPEAHSGDSRDSRGTKVVTTGCTIQLEPVASHREVGDEGRVFTSCM